MHLPHITNDKKAIVLFDFEDYFSWFSFFKLSPAKQEDVAVMNDMYQLLNKILVPETTGITLSPHFGWSVLHTKPAQCGVVFSLEQKTEDKDPLAYPMLSKQWNIEHIAHNYGIVKLQLAYHPEEQLSVQKRKLVAELYEYAQYSGVDFILDIKIKPHTTYVSTEEEFQISQLTAIKHFRQSCDAFVLETPQQALAVATITAELDVPWIASLPIITSYNELKENIRMFSENGAAGILMDVSIFHGLELPTLQTDETAFESIRKELATTVRDRVLELRRIIEEGQLAP